MQIFLLNRQNIKSSRYEFIGCSVYSARHTSLRITTNANNCPFQTHSCVTFRKILYNLTDVIFALDILKYRRPFTLKKKSKKTKRKTKLRLHFHRFLEFGLIFSEKRLRGRRLWRRGWAPGQLLEMKPKHCGVSLGHG